MSLDLSAVGFKTEPYVFEYDWKLAVLYALGIGARHDELDILYEGRGPRVFPTFPVVPAYHVMTTMIERCKAPLRNVVHAGQTIRVLNEIAPNGTLTTTGVLSGIYDLKRMARVVFETRTEQNGQAVCAMEWALIVRDTGGFGGPRPPKLEQITPPKDQAPTFEHSQAISTEQALLYRLSGDLNPLHADPVLAREVGFERGPILHGLCTLGFLARAVVGQSCSGDERRLQAVSAQFRKPVWPGETLRTLGYAVDAQNVALTAFAADRPDPIVSNAWAQILN